MRVLTGLDAITPLPNVTVAVGNFDGLHLGHQAILTRVITRARETRGTAAVLTFDPHPALVFAPHRKLKLLSSFETKCRLVEAFGIHALYCVAFNPAFIEQTPAQFAKDVLVRQIGCAAVAVGRSFRFGKDRAGGVTDLICLGKELGFDVLVQEPLFMEGEVISSSRIRGAIWEGDVQLAARMMGRDYAVEGEVIHGDGMGGTLGYPTANIELPKTLIPKSGIYAVRACISNAPGHGDSQWSGASTTRDGIAYIGTRPTFCEGATRLEVHLFDHTEPIYGAQLHITFTGKIREDERFDDVDALKRQMKLDEERARRLLAETRPYQSSAIDTSPA